MKHKEIRFWESRLSISSQKKLDIIKNKYYKDKDVNKSTLILAALDLLEIKED